MGLDYLNKKVWHPGSMKNIQKVWQVEQVQKQINKKARERAKKLLEEQHNDELKRIQVEAGLIPRSHLDRMEWMYDWGNKINQQKTNEQFLTGEKEANPGDKKQFKHVFQEEITNRKCEDFQMLHEDPMYEIMKQQKAKRDSIVNNPIEMRNIIKEVEKEYMPQDLAERRLKLMSSRRRKPSESEDRRRPDSQEEERKRKHKKRDKERKKERQRERERERSRDKHSRSRSRSSSKKSEQNSKHEKKSFKQSSIYKQYLKDRFGGILKQDDGGNLKPDYSVHRKKYKTQIQMDEQERRQKTEQLRENAKRLQSLREGERRVSGVQKERDFQEGVAKIRGEMFGGVRSNRNNRKYKKGSDSE